MTTFALLREVKGLYLFYRGGGGAVTTPMRAMAAALLRLALLALAAIRAAPNAQGPELFDVRQKLHTSEPAPGGGALSNITLVLTLSFTDDVYLDG
eukprot:CAMPEP_0118852096 /NCGR_PEP_ID=MMETSP1163-20130328/1261_1 /TAXON_ID=124430 /ORGANISM="Phaeomonas parva, Strain CCMP2877" /LENGTH=95 /DNA_ID=CAMNT_0006784499 /DNA_START=132 /DNA_END=416 /DNA_ORIENTATION=+